MSTCSQAVMLGAAGPSIIFVEYIVVAGGGGGVGPGGGGGGYLSSMSGEYSGSNTQTLNPLTLTRGVSYSVIVGGGGAGGTNTPGSYSQFEGVYATGGGSNVPDGAGTYGGSGGGGYWGYDGPGLAGGSGIYGQGFAGGSGTPGRWYCYARPTFEECQLGHGGGGGAGAVGSNGRQSSGDSGGGNGGNGIYSAVAGVYLAGGGGGSKFGDLGSTTPGNPGAGGGGSANTGGGGTNVNPGGSGVVYLKAPLIFPQAATTGSVNVYQYGGSRVYRFTSSGTITF